MANVAGGNEARAPRRHPWQRRLLEARPPMFQLHVALSHALLCRATDQSVDLDPFHASLRKFHSDIYALNQETPLGEYLLRPILCIKTVPAPPTSATTNPELEALLGCLDGKEWGMGLQMLGKCLSIDLVSYFGWVLARMEGSDSAGVARTEISGLHDNPSHRNFHPPGCHWAVTHSISRDKDFFGCVLWNHDCAPAPPGALLLGELISLLSILRRRLDDPHDNGDSTETPHQLAPPAIVLNISSDTEGKPSARVVRASFEDAPPVPPFNSGRGVDEIVLKVEVGESVDLSAMHHQSQWSDAEYAAWGDKIKTILCPLLNPRTGTAEDENEARERKIAHRFEKKEREEAWRREPEVVAEPEMVKPKRVKPKLVVENDESDDESDGESDWEAMSQSSDGRGYETECASDYP